MPSDGTNAVSLHVRDEFENTGIEEAVVGVILRGAPRGVVERVQDARHACHIWAGAGRMVGGATDGGR